MDPLEQQLLQNVGRADWQIIGRTPETDDVSGRDANNNPITTKQPTGNVIWTITDGKGHNQVMTVSGGVPNQNAGDVVKPPSDLPRGTGNQTSQPSAWTPVYQTPGDAKTPQVGQWDPVNNDFHPVAASAGAQPSGKYTTITDPNDPKNQRVIGMVDTGDKSWHPISRDPTTQKQIVNTTNKIYVFNDDGSIAQTIDVDKTSPFQAVIVDQKPYRFDPNTGTFTAGPVNVHPDIKDQNGLVMTWTGSDEEGKYAYPPGVSPPKTLTGVGTTSPNLIWYDATTGQELSRASNPNYRPPQAQLPQLNANAPMVPIEDPDKPGQIKWVKNEGQVMAGDALSNLATQLTNTVVDPNHPLTLDQAKAMLDAAKQRMDTETQQATTARGAAGDILQATTAGAQTGAGLLQNRVTNATNMVQNVLGLAGQGQRSGNMGGGLMSSMPGFGANLTQGAAAYATQLGGGQGVYDTAARMVQAADPQNKTGMAGQAYGVLGQMLERYQQATGQQHPAVLATQALNASTAGGNLTAPRTVSPAAVTPEVFQAQFDPRLNPAMPQQPVNTVLPPGVAGTVPQYDPRYLGGFTAPTITLANMGSYGGGGSSRVM